MVAFCCLPIGGVDECCAGRGKSSLPSPLAAAVAAMGSNETHLLESLTSRYSEWIMEALDDLPHDLSFLITDPYIAGHPIVFASRGFLSVSGFSREEVVGLNGRIFQGPDTDRRSVMEIREAIREERAMQISILNYRKDGTSYWILFQLCPVFGRDDGRLVHFVSVQVPIPRRVLSCTRLAVRGGLLFGACRNEVRSDLEFRCSLPFDSYDDSDNRGLEGEERREAGDREKQKAVDGVTEILSKLAQYSKLTGRVVCGNRCSPKAGTASLSSSLCTSLGRIKQSFVFLSYRTDPLLPDMPIVYASDTFLSLTGYTRDEVLGRNCRFLGGPNTAVEALQQIKESILAEKACTVRILNYRKDGTSFWNLLHISPVRNSSGKIAFYVGVQIDEGLKNDEHGLSPSIRQLGAVGAVKVAVRSLSSSAGPSSRSTS
ncbi:protein TWIN LOV 1 isoform X1 [Dendrobium catenatum]|uniref:protein TWIN LOV 1 isoform X1 n=1 Tax=Dendrobium catenatum TaxID=906689 RepID=UPI0009F44DEA|nr:protein TWIN LOV 1 isoform X1 [Dendrobium catenatum]